MILPGLQFGAGVVLATPISGTGNPPTNPTPLGLGVLQNVKMTLGADIKTLFGQSQWAVDSAVGKRSIKGTFELAQISNILMSQLFFSDATAAGVSETTTYPGEAHTVPSTSPYTVTVTNASPGPIVDWGVTYTSTGQPLTNVGSASLTAAGQYKVNLTTGVYTFYSADEGAAVLINYQWPVSGTGDTLTVAQHPMGFGPVVALNIVFPYEGGGVGFYIPNARLGKIDAATKLDDYTMYTVDYEGFAGAAGVPFVSYQAW
jgi:hypothetical protein